MYFESLANELLLEVFEYMNSVDLFRAFYGLNNRFNCLLMKYYPSHNFDFRSISKNNFDTICQEYLPHITNRITSFYLSDDNETPEQLTSFFSYTLTLHQFPQLKFLSLTRIRSIKTMNTLLQTLKYLPNLTHLDIINCYFRSSYFQIIWLQSKLNYFKVQKISPINVLLNAISLSIQHFVLHADFNQFSSLDLLLKCTPNLRCLSVSLTVDYETFQFSFIALSIQILNLYYSSSFDRLDDLLQCFPNLNQLTIRIKHIQFNGNRWEQMIKDYLLKLKIFHMMIEFDTQSNIESEKQVEEILESYQTPFWLIERQWFVQCHWDPLNKNKNYCLYTLPCFFEQSIRYITTSFKSTYPITTNQDLLSNTHHLDLILPLSNSFWLTVSEFSQLTSISVQVFDNPSVQFQLQNLFDRASHLYSLRLYSKEISPNILLAELTSKSIRHLDLRSIYEIYNEETCKKLCNTSLGIQCEVLLIQVENRTNILSLINSMKNLRALYVHCTDCIQQSNNQYFPSILTDDLIEWLKERLPITCGISIDEHFSSCVRLWI